MKKSIFLLMVVILPGIFSLSAQPISLTYTSHGIVPGDVYKYSQTNASGFNPGSGGANKIWNFTGIKADTNRYTETYVDPASTYYGYSFPEATCAFYLDQWDGASYYRSDSLGNYQIGEKTQNSDLYYVMKKIMAFPFSYDSSFTSSFSGNGQVIWVDLLSQNKQGYITSTCDGWGTLIINGRIFNNVLRIKSIEEYNEVQTLLYEDTFKSNHQKNTCYIWYSLKSKFPIFNYTIIESNDIQYPEYHSTAKIIYFNNDVTEINDNTSKQVNIVLYPNPTTGFVNLETNYTSPQKLNIELTNASGQVVYFDMVSVKAGRNVQKLNVSTLPPGIYAIRMYNDESVVVKKLILQ
jgi:hypothetical protein